MIKSEKSVRFLDLRRTAEEYPCLSRRKYQQLIKDGRLPAFRLDGKLIICRQDLERLLTATPINANLDQIVSEVLADLNRPGNKKQQPEKE